MLEKRERFPTRWESVDFWRRMALQQLSRCMTDNLIFHRWEQQKKVFSSKRESNTGRINSSSVEPASSSSPVLGPVGLLVQVPAARPHPGVLRGEDRHLLCLARLLHRLALARSSRWLGRLSLWSCLYYRAGSLSQPKCKHFTAVEALTEII